MAQNGPRITQNDPKWLKNDPKWPKYDARIYALFPQFFFAEKAVPQTFSLLECMSRHHKESAFAPYLLEGQIWLGGVLLVVFTWARQSQSNIGLSQALSPTIALCSRKTEPYIP